MVSVYPTVWVIDVMTLSFTFNDVASSIIRGGLIFKYSCSSNSPQSVSFVIVCILLCENESDLRPLMIHWRKVPTFFYALEFLIV